jgi:hypothetical protein
VNHVEKDVNNEIIRMGAFNGLMGLV